MKTVNKLFIVVGLAGILCGCKMDYFPTDELSSETLLKTESGVSFVMDGCYAALKDQITYLGYASGNYYLRHYFQMTEYPGDNTCLSSRTTDPLYQALAYTMTDDLKNVGTLWMRAYQVIGMSNTVIEACDKNEINTVIKGEAYFMRALMHLHMVTLFAKPYVDGRDNIGVPLRLSSDVTVPVTRATVGEVYDQIVADLKTAASLLGDKSRGNAGYPCKASAWGLLSRVHLYMAMANDNFYDDVITDVDNALNGRNFSELLEPNATFGDYFANTKTSSETLFCIAYETTENKGQGSLGSMYNGGGNTGWGEVYPSNPLLYMYERYPEDVRFSKLIVPVFPKKQLAGTYIYFPNPTTPDRDLVGAQTLFYANFDSIVSGGTASYFRWLTKTRKVKDTIVEGRLVKDTTVIDTIGKEDLDVVRKAGMLPGSEYKEWYITYEGEECLARVHQHMKTRTTDNNPQWFVLKFGNQDGIPQLCSPVLLRWGEVVLNLAEAKYHKGDAKGALDLVNILRDRAGIPTAGHFEIGKLHGYDPVNPALLADGSITSEPVLNIILDERRLELAFEGFRVFDQIRYHLNIDRRYPGANPWEIVPYNRQHMQYPIPFAEWSVSGIPQNPGY